MYFIFRQGLSLNVELIDHASLADQYTQGTLMTLHLHTLNGITDMGIIVDVHMALRDPCSGPQLAG